MKTCFAASLLLLSILISSHEAQGIRLDKGSFMSVGHKDLVKTSNGEDEVIVCKDGDECKTAAGNIRKRITIGTSASTTISEKNNEHKKATGKGFGGKEEALHANTSLSSPEEEKYPPEIVDIAEMDYSPARRKPPIHN